MQSPSLRIPALSFLALACGLTACSGDNRITGADGSDSGVSAGETEFAEDSGSGGEMDKLDLGDGMGDDGADCVDPTTGADLDYKFSVIWIANSDEGSVSKVDTITATEEGRYYTGAQHDLDSPSRTSVNLVGDVVIGNRGYPHEEGSQSSFTKIMGDRDACGDKNGDGQITTSTGPDDILPWGEDECVAWNYPVPGQGARAVAWDAGEYDACGVKRQPNVWVAYRNNMTDDGEFISSADNGFVHVDYVDGYAGTLTERVVVDDPDFYVYGYGVYGGAADGNGNFIGNNNGTLVYVDRETFEWRIGPGGGYGIALDAEGNAWGTGGSGRVSKSVDGEGLEWYNGAIGGYDRGVVVDRNNHLWMVTNGPCGIARLDIASGTWTDPAMTWDGCLEPVGVSVDFEGHVWVVDRQAAEAIKLLPNDLGQGVSEVARVGGLVSPYTYSDMTGAMLNLVVNPPVG